MPRSARDENDVTSLKDARIEYAIRQAVVAAILFDPKGFEAILELSDVEVGRLLKNELCIVAGVATVYDLDLPSIREEEENLRKRFKRASKPRTSEQEASTESVTANSERYSLVRQGKVLRRDDFCKAAAITEKKLSKNVASGRIFSVDFGQEPYYPAFFLPSVIHRNDFGKVIRRLGETSGWNKWDFFTTPIEPEGGSTPLQLLAIKEVKRVLMAVADFTER
ncbi:hypothetical protein F6X40_05945 [Paraburkholderia sp. UCT31]|uniref:hypothetical protein n=1 Tax=Paraburkholderia sp. UCT31 TaxID=2615209 RepID=UPI00165637A9|nr:hypothetical protein [Paraburkholderia sp. UCT31]MBC8736379.1 hypothetical protein [Paraburkholderia sp. UCT31]